MNFILLFILAVFGMTFATVVGHAGTAEESQLNELALQPDYTDDLAEFETDGDDSDKAKDGEDELIETLQHLDAVPDADIFGLSLKIFKNGDGRRFTTLNFAYQLACYSGVGGSFFSQALWALKRFNGYGCYCGGGHYVGNYLDNTDKCCKVHDDCYTRVMKKYKLSLGCHTYTVPYSVSCCKAQKLTKCTDSGPSAGRELCECDQKMSECVAKSAGTYNSSYMKNRSKCTGKFHTKPMSFWQILKSCKKAFKPAVSFKRTYGSQGSCPVSVSRRRRRRRWGWGK